MPLDSFLYSVWECDCSCFLKYFFANKCIKIIYFFKKLFLISAYQNDSKIIIKKLNKKI
jgi:hypothetical protein